MTFRNRLAFAFGVTTLFPLALLAYGVRRELRTRLDLQADRRVRVLIEALRADLAINIATTRARLRTYGGALAADNQFRLAVLSGNDADRRWLLDWAGNAMPLGGLAMLQVQDSAGRILSSGHFRNEYDRLEPELPRAIIAADSGALLVRAPAAEGSFLALASIDSFSVGGRRFVIVGGRAIDSTELARLSRDPEVGVGLLLPGDSTVPLAHEIVDEIALPFIDASGFAAGQAAAPGLTAAPRVARLIVTRDPGPLLALRRSVDRWFFIALAIALLAGMILAAWLAARVSRPLAELAEKTGRVDLDRLDQDFATDRNDEVGALSRLLDAMTRRLRASIGRLREAERRATMGDLARQINHDVKNGLAPIRHVLRHLTQVAEREPERLAAIYRERQVTLESSVEYLENLARNYAKLTPALDLTSTDPNAVLREIARTIVADNVTIETNLTEALPPLRVDPVVLRRILENLAGNAVDAVQEKGGRITLLSELAGNGSARRVRLIVADTGRGMTREELEHAFDDFYTTKDQGTGLGLSVVRRLVNDLGGSLKVKTAPGQGSRFTVELPV